MSILPRVVVLCAAVACCVASDASARAPANNPYASLDSTKGVWPPFYKPDPNDAKYLKMMADGVCKPTGKTAQAFYQSKMVDVNKLPEFSLEGKITEVAGGSVTAVDSKTGESFLILVHEDRTISRVRVEGKGTKEMLAAGAFVRFVGKVDASGTVADKLDKIELTTPGMHPTTPVKPNEMQNLTGKILRHDGEHLVVNATSGKVRRLEVDLKDDAAVAACVADHRYASVGDKVTMKGRILRVANPAQVFCFADELDITAAGIISPAKSPKLAAAQTK
jgi:hypothetical protein